MCSRAVLSHAPQRRALLSKGITLTGILGLSCLLLALPATKAQAQYTQYTNQATFSAAAGSTTVETFGTSPLSNTTGAYAGSFNGFSLSGNGNGNNIGVHNGAVGSFGPNYPIPAPFTGQNFFSWGDATAGGNGNRINPLTFTFSQPTTAFGFDWFNTDFSDQYTITFNSAAGSSTYSAPPFTVASNGVTTSGFFGVTSTSAITSVVIQNQFLGGYVSDEGFDNVRVGGISNAALTPEAPALVNMAGALLAPGLGGLLSLRRRRKARIAA